MLEFKYEDALQRARAYFDGERGSDRVIDRSEFPQLVRHLQSISVFKSQKFRFDDFTKMSEEKKDFCRFDFVQMLKKVLTAEREKEQKTLNAQCSRECQAEVKRHESEIDVLKALLRT